MAIGESFFSSGLPMRRSPADLAPYTPKERSVDLNNPQAVTDWIKQLGGTGGAGAPVAPAPSVAGPAALPAGNTFSGGGTAGFGNPFSQLGDMGVFNQIMGKMEPAFEQRAQDYTSDAMAAAGAMGNRYGSFGAREAGRQGARAALESQSLFQPLMMQNMANNLNLANLGMGFEFGQFDREYQLAGAEQEAANAQQNAYFQNLMQLLGLGGPQQSYPVMYGADQPGAAQLAQMLAPFFMGGGG